MDKSNPLVSIIIPVYNVEKYLRTCLDSILNQTYKNIEVICVNDGSPDNSISILNEYASRDKRVIVFDEPNKGVASARNLGIEKATGQLLTFADADDWWELNAFEQNIVDFLCNATIPDVFYTTNRIEWYNDSNNALLFNYPTTSCSVWYRMYF